MYERWAGVLSMIIWLDASDDTLLKRVFDRKKWHRIKEKSVSDSYEFLAGCRGIYDEVLGAITSRASSSPFLFRLDTTSLSMERVCDEAVTAINLRMK
jgi:deoxyadenosine/deoxycytidine kinase